MSLIKTINKLNEVNEDICLSVSIPTVKTGDYEKNRIRWKNAVNVLKADCEKNEISCKSLFERVDEISNDPKFWSKQEHGLVGYFSNYIFELVHLKHETISLTDVGTTFNLYPLISELQAHSSIYVFCVSKNATNLYLVSNGNVSKIDISENVVDNYEEAMNFDDSSKSLQHHSVGGGDAYFHGNGSVVDNSDVRTSQYLKRVDDGLMEVIQGQNIPLVLACVEEYYPIYKEMTSYNHLLTDIIAGNPDQLNEDEILEKSNCILTDILGKHVNDFLLRFNETASRDLPFDTIDDFRNSIKMQNIESILVNESQLSNMDLSERCKVTRDIVGAYNIGAKIICVTDPDSDSIILGLNRFKIESA